MFPEINTIFGLNNYCRRIPICLKPYTAYRVAEAQGILISTDNVKSLETKICHNERQIILAQMKRLIR